MADPGWERFRFNQRTEAGDAGRWSETSAADGEVGVRTPRCIAIAHQRRDMPLGDWRRRSKRKERVLSRSRISSPLYADLGGTAGNATLGCHVGIRGYCG